MSEVQILSPRPNHTSYGLRANHRVIVIDCADNTIQLVLSSLSKPGLVEWETNIADR